MEKNIKNELNRYFSDLQFRINIYDKAKKEMDIHIASNFNVFAYISPNENKLSDILADLLNPDGKHGQKEAFLKEFLKIIKKNLDIDLMSCKVIREDSTSHIESNQRRIDITLNFEKFAIGIENKPWNDEQENQLQDYQAHLQKKYGDDFCMVYISGDGSEPESLTEETKQELLSEEKLFILSYEGHIKDWLENCYKECKSEKIRIFIQDFIKYICQNFKNIYEYAEEI